MTKYAVCFDYPDVPDPVFAGMYKDTFGWAPTLRTALLFETEEMAQQLLDNCYGENARTFGSVVEVAE